MKGKQKTTKKLLSRGAQPSCYPTHLHYFLLSNDVFLKSELRFYAIL
jgi:hypothetical protein